MASTIQIKNSTTASNSPSSLTTGELAINVVDGNFFYGSGSAVKQDFAVSEITASIISASNKIITSELSAHGDLTIDADGADIVLKDGGTAFGRFKRDTSDFVIKSETQDKDILFKGNDGGSTITALTLDMSDAGKAIFTGNVSASGDINCDNLTVATSITSVGDDVIIGDDLVLSSAAAKLRFSGSAGGGNEAIQYYDSNGDVRNVVMFTGTNTFSIMNRAPSGKVEIRANSSTAGSSGEVTVATFEHNRISLNVQQRRLIEVSSTTDGDGNGDYIKLGSTSVTAGKIYYYNSSGNWVETDADAASSSTGLIAVAMGNTSAKGMMLKGMVTLNHDPGTVGDILYLRAGTSGEATSTAPSGTGDIVRVIGYCLDSSNGQIYFNPSNDFIEHS
jgi:hypothetical protein